MEKKFYYVIILIVLGTIVSSVPLWFTGNLLTYIAGVLSFVVILLALTFFFVKMSEPVKKEKMADSEGSAQEAEEATRGEVCSKKLLKCWNSVCDRCNSVGFALFCCVILIVGLGVFDALTSKKNENIEPHKLELTVNPCSFSSNGAIDNSNTAVPDTLQ